ncbi:porin family protein [Dyella japonica]|uniref:Outer membrane protein beta-barrel domain-containing protein n=1 Tax=Dyella japonica A8 TaxID=1217721 RepID=A0A075JZV3_9GAMM|nr:porin family protein [Dyella japonica]AIF47596.1 hypothetical protein HY57_10115 [Dyella japonica A8]
MRQLLLSVSLGALLLAAPLASRAAVETGNGDLFVNASLGSAHSDVSGLTKQDDFGYGVNVGYRWNDTWGVEAGYVDLGKPEAKGYPVYNNTYNLKLHVTGWTLGVNGKLNLAEHWFLSARLGAFFSNTKLTVEGYSNDFSANDTNLYVGVGAGYNFSRNLSVGINFDRYEAKAKGILTNTNNPYLLSGTVEYRFGL